MSKKEGDFSPKQMGEFLQAYSGKANYGGITYWGGKDLVRLAKYMMMAKDLQHPSYDIIKSHLKRALSNWFSYEPNEEKHYFAWYERWKGLVGFDHSYGSFQFTDNHFHYGYFTYAAALLAMEDHEIDCSTVRQSSS
jgi:endoglucanase Acf2